MDRLDEILISDIYIDEDFNCREVITPISLGDLADSIRLQGLIQPILVSEATESEQKEYNKKYILIAGFRRTKAVEMILGWSNIRAVVTHVTDRLARRVINLLENLDRTQLNILQEARAIKPFVEAGWTRKRICEALGKKDGWVQTRTYLLELPEEIQNDAASGIITQTNIRELYSVKQIDNNPETLYQMVRDLKSKKERGERSVSINPYIKKANVKHKPSEKELRQLLDHYYDSRIGPGLHTKCLAYALGEIELVRVYEANKEYASDKGILYIQPVEAKDVTKMEEAIQTDSTSTYNSVNEGTSVEDKV